MTDPTLALRAVIFDMDGVLTDSEPLINAAAVAMFREMGLLVQPEDFLPFVGTGRRPLHRRRGGEIPVSPRHAGGQETHLRNLPRAGAAAARRLPRRPALVRRCREAGLRVAVASSADLIKIEANLHKIGLPPAEWDAIVSAEDVDHKKPAPDIFLAAARKLGVPPEGCVVVEDAVNGVQAAKAAGMRCVAVAQTFPGGEAGRRRPGAPRSGRRDAGGPRGLNAPAGVGEWSHAHPHLVPLPRGENPRHSGALCAPEPGRDAFHRVPIFSGESRDAVERIPTSLNGRFMGSLELREAHNRGSS